MTSMPPLLAEAIRLLDDAAETARDGGRDDIAARLAAVATRLAQRRPRVLVVGEFKQGKSSLINALVDQPVCPVDDDVTTAVPITVRFGERARAQATLSSSDTTVSDDVDIADITRLATDAAEEAERALSVEIEIPSDLLRAGLELVDTPGIGGLGSAHGAVTAAALPSADAVLLVSDASQPLTRPEMELLASAREVCPAVVCVLTKTDLYPAWRKVADLDEAALAGAGITAQVVPVAAILHGAAAVDAAESGIPALRELLRTEVIDKGAQLAARASATTVGTVAHQLLSTLAAEHATQVDPSATGGVTAALEAARARAASLEAASASWQQTLSARLEQLAADVDHRLQASMRDLRRDAEEALDQGDPAKIWEQFEAWLTRGAGAAVAEAYVFVASGQQRIVAEVLSAFGDDEGAIVASLDHAAPDVETPHLGALERRAVAKESWGERGVSLLHGAHGGMEVLTLLAGVVGLAVANPLVIGLGLLLGGQAIRLQRAARVTARREAAVEIVGHYLDDVLFNVSKDLADTVRSAERSLHENLSQRARELNESLREAAAAAERTLTTSASDRAARANDLAGAIGRWTDLDDRARGLLGDSSGR